MAAVVDHPIAVVVVSAEIVAVTSIAVGTAIVAAAGAVARHLATKKQNSGIVAVALEPWTVVASCVLSADLSPCHWFLIDSQSFAAAAAEAHQHDFDDPTAVDVDVDSCSKDCFAGPPNVAAGGSDG